MLKAIILAAGKSTRTYPLTLTKPKPLLKINNKTLLEHNLEQLKEIVDEVVIIIGYKGDMIKKQLGNEYEGIKIKYVKQKEQLGTGHAVLQADKFMKNERFIVMMGDDLYFRGDIRKCLRYEYTVLAKRVDNYSDFGVFVKKGDRVLNIEEKPSRFVSDLVNTGFYIFDDKIMKILAKIEKSPRGEIELPAALQVLAEKEDIFSVEAKVWLPIAYPWNVLEADQIVRDSDLKVGKNTEITGQAHESTIGANCKIEGFVKNSLIGDNVTIHRDSVVEDSVIGNNVDFLGTIKTKEKVDIKINGKTRKVDNFGAVVGDGCKLKDVFLQPGTMVWPDVEKEGDELRGIVKK